MAICSYHALFYVSRLVVKSLSLEMSDDQIDNMIRAADGDGDGSISYQEFAKLMLSTNPRKAY